MSGSSVPLRDIPAVCESPATAPARDSQQCAPMTAAEEGAHFERDFYLQEFRGRTLGIACPAGLLRDAEQLAAVVQTLARNDTNVIVISSRRDRLAAVVGERILPAATRQLETAVWRALRQSSRLGILVGGRRPFAAQMPRAGAATRPLQAGLDRSAGRHARAERRATLVRAPGRVAPAAGASTAHRPRTRRIAARGRSPAQRRSRRR